MGLVPFDEEQEHLGSVIPKIDGQCQRMKKVPRYVGDDFLREKDPRGKLKTKALSRFISYTKKGNKHIKHCLPTY